MHFLSAKNSYIAIACVTLLLSAYCQAGKPLKIGEKAPDWILPNSFGEHLSLYQDSDAQQVVILFWATWCPFCAELMPELKTLQNELRNQPVKFYALDVWDDGDAKAFMAEHGYEFTLMMNADMVAKRYNVHGTPGLFVLDKEKNIRYVRDKGASVDDVVENIKRALQPEHK